MPVRPAPILLLMLCTALAVPAGLSAENTDMGGWEVDSPYNRLYDAREMDSFKGVVKKVYAARPMKGMSPGVILEIAEDEETVTKVHLCPEWFRDSDAIGVRRGDRVKVKGVWAEIDGEFIFMASKVKKGDFFEFKVRVTGDGTPFWTLTPEEQAQHSNF